MDVMAAAVEALRQLPDVQVGEPMAAPSVGAPQADYLISGKVRHQSVYFIVECKPYGHPRDIEQAIVQLRMASEHWRIEDECTIVVPMVVAPALSQGSRALLRHDHVAYSDSGGSVYLEVPSAYYLVDKPSPKVSTPGLRHPFRGKATQVLHALLLDATHSWHIVDIASRAEVQPSTAHRVCKWLEDQLWMESTGSGPRTVRRLVQPAALLEAMAKAHSQTRYTVRRYHRWTQGDLALIDIVSDALDAANIAHAFTLASGARFVAPHATDTGRAWVILGAGDLVRADAALTARGFGQVETGEAITVLGSFERAPLMFRQRVAGHWVASDVQLYIDLCAWPQRGKAQAEHLRAERLAY